MTINNNMNDSCKLYYLKSKLGSNMAFFLPQLYGLTNILKNLEKQKEKNSFLSEYKFRVADIEFKITDVGGGRADRLYWIEELQVVF